MGSMLEIGNGLTASIQQDLVVDLLAPRVSSPCPGRAAGPDIFHFNPRYYEK